MIYTGVNIVIGREGDSLMPMITCTCASLCALTFYNKTLHISYFFINQTLSNQEEQNVLTCRRFEVIVYFVTLLVLFLNCLLVIYILPQDGNGKIDYAEFASMMGRY